MYQQLFVMLMENKKKLDIGVIQRHVEHLKELDKCGKLFLCGPFQDYPGGIVVLNVSSFEEADSISKADPYICEGYKSYELRTLEWANTENNFLLD